MSDELRVFAGLRGDGGISGTDASFASQRSRCPDEFVCNEVTAPRCYARIGSRHRKTRGHVGEVVPLPSRHARETLTTLQLSRCVEPGSSTPAAGAAQLARVPVGCRRR